MRQNGDPTGCSSEPRPQRWRAATADRHLRFLRHETSQILEKVFRALRAEGVSRTAVAQDLQVPLKPLNDLIFGLVLSPLASADPTPSETAAAQDRPRLRIV